MIDDHGALLLASAVIEDAAKDYKRLWRKRKKLTKQRDIDNIDADLRYLERFFTKNPLMGVFSVSGDHVIKCLREQAEDDNQKLTFRILKGK